MGQVFTLQAVKSGQVPKAESFGIVTSLLRTTLASESSVVSALLFGSVLRGDSNIRSDIDCLVIYDVAQEERAVSVMQVLSEQASKLFVPINFVPCDSAIARTRLHHLGPSFTTHLQSSVDSGGCIKGDITKILAPTLSIKEEIESYIRVKMYNLQESSTQVRTFSDDRRVSFLKKGLEAPTHIARKMLIYEGAMQGDSKRHVHTRYRETMSQEMVVLFDELVALDAWYTIQLETQMQKLDEEEYQKVLVSLEKEMPKLIQFIRLNILRIQSMTRS